MTRERLTAAIGTSLRNAIPAEHHVDLDALANATGMDIGEAALQRSAEYVAQHRTAAWCPLGAGRLLLIPANLGPVASVTTSDGTVVNAYANLPTGQGPTAPSPTKEAPCPAPTQSPQA